MQWWEMATVCRFPHAAAAPAPFTWTATGLPAGMSIRYGSGVTSDYVGPEWGEIWGVASTPGTYNVTVTVKDFLGSVPRLLSRFMSRCSI